MTTIVRLKSIASDANYARIIKAVVDKKKDFRLIELTSYGFGKILFHKFTYPDDSKFKKEIYEYLLAFFNSMSQEGYRIESLSDPEKEDEIKLVMKKRMSEYDGISIYVEKNAGKKTFKLVKLLAKSIQIMKKSEKEKIFSTIDENLYIEKNDNWYTVSVKDEGKSLE